MTAARALQVSNAVVALHTARGDAQSTHSAGRAGLSRARFIGWRRCVGGVFAAWVSHVTSFPVCGLMGGLTRWLRALWRAVQRGSIGQLVPEQAVLTELVSGRSCVPRCRPVVVGLVIVDLLPPDAHAALRSSLDDLCVVDQLLEDIGTKRKVIRQAPPSVIRLLQIAVQHAMHPSLRFLGVDDEQVHSRPVVDWAAASV